MKKVIYSIGDSFTFRGPQYKSWSYFLSNKLNLLDDNNGISGSSNDRTYRSVVRDVSRIIDKKLLWTESLGETELTIDEVLFIVQWTSPTRYELFSDGEFLQSRDWTKSKFSNGKNKRLDFEFSDEINFYLTNELSCFIKHLNQIITLKLFLEKLNINSIFFNGFYPIGDNIINLINNFKNEVKQFKSFDNPSTYFEIDSLWKMIPRDYKDLNMFEYVGKNNLDETLHPTETANKIWSEKLEKYIEENKLCD